MKILYFTDYSVKQKINIEVKMEELETPQCDLSLKGGNRNTA